MKTVYLEKNLPKMLAVKLFSKISKSAYFASYSPVVFKSMPDQPLPRDNWVRVKNKLTGICGSDLSLFKVAPQTSIAMVPLPGSQKTFFGHETVGEVIEAGPAVKSVKVGDRVVMTMFLGNCHIKDIHPLCARCRAGDYVQCENYGEPGPEDLGNTGAGLGDTYIGPEIQVMKIPDSISDDEAIMMEPAAVGVHAVLRAAPKKGDKVLVLGAGAIGLCVIQALRALYPECTVYVYQHSRFKRELALKMGAHEAIGGDLYKEAARITGAHYYEGMMNNRMLMGGFDVVFDCIGTPRMMHDSLRIVRAKGKIIKIGAKMAPTKFDETPLWWQEIDIIGINGYATEHIDGREITTFELVKELILDGRLQLNDMITQRYKLSEYKEAFKHMICHSNEVVKVAVEID